MTTFVTCQQCVCKKQFAQHPVEKMNTFAYKSGPVLICDDCAKDFSTSEIGACWAKNHLVDTNKLVDAENIGSRQTLEEVQVNGGNIFPICTDCEAQINVS